MEVLVKLRNIGKAIILAALTLGAAGAQMIDWNTQIKNKPTFIAPCGSSGYIWFNNGSSACGSSVNLQWLPSGPGTKNGLVLGIGLNIFVNKVYANYISIFNAFGDTDLLNLSTQTLTLSGSGSFGGNLAVTGSLTAGSLAFTNLSISGNSTIGGTLGVTGTTTLGVLSAGATTLTTLGTSGLSTLNSLTVTNGTSLVGSVATGGTLGVGSNLTVVGTSTLGGLVTMSGNATVAGTLGVTGVTTLTGNVSVGGAATGTGAVLATPSIGITTMKELNPFFLTTLIDNTGTWVGTAVNTGGSVQAGTNVSASSYVQGSKLQTNTNCSSAATPAVCGSAAAGSFALAAGSTVVQVNTTAVTATSQILLFFDQSLSSKLSITCNATVPTVYGVTARTAGASFTLTATSPSTNPACFSYLILN